MRNNFILILIVLTFGALFKLALTDGGNFFFNMDNARDFVEVREMVELGKIRLTGPTSAINGLFNGPGWYYLLSIPYLLSHGDPYGAIVMQIILWALGGLFLLKLIENYSRFLILPIGFVWISSNYIVLANRYSFNPNPIVFLTPLFIYLLTKYIKTEKPYYIILTWFLAGVFFNFEMNFGIFTPLIIIVSLVLNKSARFFKSRFFWIGVAVFIVALLPQILFDFKHQFIMSKAIIKFLSENKSEGFNVLQRVEIISKKFYDVFQATLMNQKLLSLSILILAIPVFKKFILKGKNDISFLISLTVIIVPYLGYLIIPVSVNPWHLGAEAAASLIFIAFILSRLWKYNFVGKIFSIVLSLFLIFYSVFNIPNYFTKDREAASMDTSLFKNELAAIDYVYKKAQGANFKVYTYLPSVYDYPYQYLFWWYGKKTYGFVPGEYRYSPNKPQYIPSQGKFEGRKDNLSDLVFLVKEPDRIQKREAWEGDFKDMKLISKEMVGPIEIEERLDVRK